MPRRILRLARTDAGTGSSDFVIVQVSQASTDSPDSLDLKVLGTDNEGEYAGKISSSSCQKLRVKNYSGSDDEWKAVLRKTLLHQPDGPTSATDLADVECVASVTAGRELTIVWRRNANKIIQRLGSLSLTPTQGEIDLFEWSSIAAEAVSEAHDAMARRNASMQEQSGIIEDLQAQLDDLVETKASHEAQLLSKFCKILNAKKLKIREQQRLLATSMPNADTAKLLHNVHQDEEKPAARQKVTTSRTNKRKATAPVATASESDEGFEPAPLDGMDIDQSEDEDRQEFAEQVTPDATDIESDDDDDLDRQSIPNARTSTSLSQSRVNPKEDGKKTAERDLAQSGLDDASTSQSIPARRELPFKSGATSKAGGPLPVSNKASPIADERADETDSDDEL